MRAYSEPACPSPDPRQFCDVEETAAIIGAGRTKVFELLRTGELPSILIGRKRLIPPAAIGDLIARRLADGPGR